MNQANPPPNVVYMSGKEAQRYLQASGQNVTYVNGNSTAVHSFPASSGPPQTQVVYINNSGDNESMVVAGAFFLSCCVVPCAGLLSMLCAKTEATKAKVFLSAGLGGLLSMAAYFFAYYSYTMAANIYKDNDSLTSFIFGDSFNNALYETYSNLATTFLVLGIVCAVTDLILIGLGVTKLTRVNTKQETQPLATVEVE